MKVMSFNLRTDFMLDINNRWNRRKHIVYDIINKFDCDIIGVQELNENMYNDLSINLNNYNIVGERRTKRFFSEKNDILVNKRNKVLDYNTFWLSKDINKIGSSVWYSLYPRICTTALIELNNGNRIRVYNTHLDCGIPLAKKYGLLRISQYIDKKDKEGEVSIPIILMGDFNLTPSNKIINEFKSGIYCKRKLMAVQEFKKDIYNMSTISGFKGYRKGLHIDYIFVSSEFKVNNVEIVNYNENGKYPSDHYPIYADIDLFNMI